MKEIFLKSVKEATDFITDQGYKLSAPTLYRHLSENKLIRRAEGFAPADLLRYADVFLKRVGDSQPGGQVYNAVEEKQAAEARKVAAQAEHWELRTRILSNEYVERGAHEMALARRAMVFKSDGENFFRMAAGEIINMVKGDPTLAPELIDFCLTAFEGWLDRYCRDSKSDLPEQIDLSNLKRVEQY